MFVIFCRFSSANLSIVCCEHINSAAADAARCDCVLCVLCSAMSLLSVVSTLTVQLLMQLAVTVYCVFCVQQCRCCLL